MTRMRDVAREVNMMQQRCGLRCNHSKSTEITRKIHTSTIRRRDLQSERRLRWLSATLLRRLKVGLAPFFDLLHGAPAVR